MKKNFGFVCLAIITQMVFSKSFAEDKKYHVEKVMLHGNAHIPDDSVLYYLGLTTQRDYTKSEIDKMVKKAYDTGFFKKISVNYSDFKNIMMVEIVEQPVISAIKFYGNRKISDKDISNNLKTKTGMTFSETKMKKDVENILRLYQARGYFNAIINPKIIEEEGGGITVAFEVKEGKKAVIEKISFVGNNKFSESDLKQNILSNEWAIYRFFSSSYNYDSERFKVDAELIAEYYQSRGYPFARVVNTVTELDNKKQAFILTFFIESGDKLNFGKVMLKDEIKISNNKEIIEALSEIKKGKEFNINTIRVAIEKINDVLAGKGYAFAKIDHKIDLNPKTNEIDVTVTINPTTKFFINKINIINNISTKDEVIRREMRVSEQDSYDISKIERSIQRIKNLGYFNEVNFIPKQVGDSDKVDLEVSVDEKRTGTAIFNVAYSKMFKGSVGFSYSEANLLGSGRNLSTSLNVGKKQKHFDVSLLEPYFMGFDATGGLSVFVDRSLIDDSTGYEYSSYSHGMIANTSYNLSEYLKHELQYGLKFEKIHSGVRNEDMSVFFRQDTKTRVLSSIGHSLMYDKTDNFTNATNGYLLTFNQTFVGLGGSARFLQHTVSGSHYTPIYKDKVIMKLTARAGIMNGITRKIHIADNFNAEDNLIRGFQYNGIGARDASNTKVLNFGQSLGGKKFFTTSAEMKFPLGSPNEIGIHGVAFVDLATLYDIDVPDGVDTKQNPYFDSKNLRGSYGMGVVWSSPVGLLSFNYGIPFMKEKFDIVQRFNFSIGKSF